MTDERLMGSERAPEEHLQELINGAVISKSLSVAARLGVADRLAEGPRHFEALAGDVGAEPMALYRILRALASRGVFFEQGEESGVFELSSSANLLRSDIAGSRREFAAMHGAPWMWDAIGYAHRTVENGAPAFRDRYEMGIFEYFQEVPEEGAEFYEGMRQVTERLLPAVLDAYDFSTYTHVMDIGGGLGNLLAALLQAYPHLQGTLFDLPARTDEARTFLDGQEVGDRCAVMGGDFFEAIPEGADLHVLKWIIHDWSDEQAGTILRNCRRAIAPGGRLLLVEQVLPAANQPSWAQVLDIIMMLMEGGRERTESEFARLFRDAGFRLSRCVPLEGPWCLIEGEPI